MVEAYLLGIEIGMITIEDVPKVYHEEINKRLKENETI